jgi:hypothetical protein
MHLGSSYGICQIISVNREMDHLLRKAGNAHRRDKCATSALVPKIVSDSEFALCNIGFSDTQEWQLEHVRT